MYEDLSKFPSGMKGLGDWVHGEGFLYGLYSCRGTCQCGTGSYHAPGSHGYEAADVDWMVAAGADYLKIDSCCGDQNHAVAFSDYAKFRDAMNATVRFQRQTSKPPRAAKLTPYIPPPLNPKQGKRVWFSLCGWESWYSCVCKQPPWRANERDEQSLARTGAYVSLRTIFFTPYHATTDTDFLLQAARPLPQLHGRRVAGQQLAHRGRRQRLGTAH